MGVDRHAQARHSMNSNVRRAFSPHMLRPLDEDEEESPHCSPRTLHAYPRIRGMNSPTVSIEMSSLNNMFQVSALREGEHSMSASHHFRHESQARDYDIYNPNEPLEGSTDNFSSSDQENPPRKSENSDPEKRGSAKHSGKFEYGVSGYSAADPMTHTASLVRPTDKIVPRDRATLDELENHLDVLNDVRDKMLSGILFF